MTTEEEFKEILTQIDKLHHTVSKLYIKTLNKEETVKVNVKEELNHIMEDNNKIFKELAKQ